MNHPATPPLAASLHTSPQEALVAAAAVPLVLYGYPLIETLRTCRLQTSVDAPTCYGRAPMNTLSASERPLRDAKTTLQEWAQARGLGTPTYQALDRAGPDHAPAFTIAVYIADRPPAEGRGGSKRVAEQAAAEAFLAREGVLEKTG